MGTCHVDFNFFEDQIVSLASFVSDEVPISDEIEMGDVWCCADPPMLDWVSTIGPNLDYAKVEFTAPTPPSVIEDGPSAFNEGSLSAYCRLA